MIKSTFKTTVVVLTLGYLFLGVSACNSGSDLSAAPSPIFTPTPTPVPTPTPTPAPTPESGALAGYVQLLTYTPITQSSSNFSQIESKQLSITPDSPLAVSNISYHFYSDNICTNEISMVSIAGYTVMNSGTYTTTSAANIALCSKFNYLGSGCLYEYLHTNSIKIRITPYNPSLNETELCLTNPDTSGERLANYYNAIWSGNCASGTCSFSRDYNISPNNSLKY